MLPRLAQAVETFFGRALAPAADLLRGIAEVALVAAITLAVLRAVLAYTAFRSGWEMALVVRCPRCRRLVADPSLSTCPSGHPVRFPRGAAAREERRQRFHAFRRLAAAYRWLLPAALALAVVVAWRWAGVARVEGPLASVTAALAYLFFIAAIALGGLLLAPGTRGVGERLLHGGTALLCLLPALGLALLARGFEPPRPRAIGSLWTTPTAVYLAAGESRARRVAEAAGSVEALLVEVRAPAFGVVWQGLKGFRSGDRTFRWRGRGGFLARLLDRFAAPLSRRGVFLSRSGATVPLPPNQRIWIVTEPGVVRFASGGAFDVP